MTDKQSMEEHGPDVKILPPDTRIQEKLGKDRRLKDFVTDDSLKNAQRKTKDQVHLFLEEAEQELQAMLTAYQGVLQNKNANREAIDELMRPAFSIKSRAGTFGYDLASKVSKSLHDYIEDKTSVTDDDRTVIEAHIQTLTAIFHGNIKGDGGAVGTQLYESLVKLIAKYT